MAYRIRANRCAISLHELNGDMYLVMCVQRRILTPVMKLFSKGVTCMEFLMFSAVSGGGKIVIS